jgi:hypothetical protein
MIWKSSGIQGISEQEVSGEMEETEEGGGFTVGMRVDLHYTARLSSNLTLICQNYLQRS